MVLINNKFELREFLLNKLHLFSRSNNFLKAFLIHLNLSPITEIDISNLTNYEKCTIESLINKEVDLHNELVRLFGQAAIVDGTPRPWVMDIWGLLSIKIYVDNLKDLELTEKFKIWISSFLPNQINKGHLISYEKDISLFIIGENEKYNTAIIPLFLHYLKIQPIYENKNRLNLIHIFLNTEFKNSFIDENFSENILAALIYVFDKADKDISTVPPNGWSFEDLCNYLNNITPNLRRWTWELKPRTQGAEIVRWQINNEYHVQNLLYTLLAPIFPDIKDEENLPSIGQKKPRIDLYIPSLHTLIEVKYRKNTSKSFSELIGEIGEDASLYLSSESYSDAKVIVFLWDQTRSTQEHATFKMGIKSISGINECIIANSPSFIN